MSATPGQSESEFTAAVIELAEFEGWLVHHCRPARRANGSWSTPIQGSAGFPDLVLVHPELASVLVLELKVGSAKPTANQLRWLAGFTTAGVQALTVTPSSWDELARMLSWRRGRGRLAR